jgi:hypothetical protein
MGVTRIDPQVQILALWPATKSYNAIGRSASKDPRICGKRDNGALLTEVKLKLKLKPLKAPP